MNLRKTVAVLLFATTSMAANAATYFVQLTGTVTSQVDPGADPNIALGDTVRMTGRFDDSRIFDNGTFRAANVYGLPTSGDQFWKVTLNGLTWKSVDEYLDGLPSDFDSQGHPLQAPYFELLPGGKIGTPQGWLIPVNTDQTPTFDLGSGQIRSGDFLYGNTSKTPGFNVTWDLGGASFAQVPEPTTWAMMIVGFGLIGMTARRRGRALPSITC